jgi:hypothetical protein
MIIIEGIGRANIKTLKYLLITELGADFEIFCTLSPKIKEDVPIKNETTVRRFCVTEVITVEVVLVFICFPQIQVK